MNRSFQVLGAKHAGSLIAQLELVLTEKAESSLPDYTEAIGVDLDKKSHRSVLRLAADVVASNDLHPGTWSARIAAGADYSGHFQGSKVHLVTGLPAGPVRVAIQWAAPDGGLNCCDPTLGPSTPEGMSLLIEEVEPGT